MIAKVQSSKALVLLAIRGLTAGDPGSPMHRVSRSGFVESNLLDGSGVDQQEDLAANVLWLDLQPHPLHGIFAPGDKRPSNRGSRAAHNIGDYKFAGDILNDSLGYNRVVRKNNPRHKANKKRQKDVS